ncbi:MAG: efflux RND transporter permease subunit [Bryobacteraceae bacterium]|nr:efflux RND transporter permease subunit [Bryobacteraceae bacterium]
MTIPLSLLFAFVCMRLAGIHASLLSLGAIDFGIIVDGTLVMVEFMVRRISHDPDSGLPARRAAIIEEAASTMQRPIFFSLVILVAAYIPLFALERVEARLFTPMAFTICSALLGSLLFALTLAPALATFLFRSGGRSWRNPLLRRLTRGYEVALRVLLNRPWGVVVASAVIVGGALFAGARLGTEFLPHLAKALSGFGRSSAWNLAGEIDRGSLPNPVHCPRVPAGATGDFADGTPGVQHRAIRPESERVSGGADALFHLAGGNEERRSRPAAFRKAALLDTRGRAQLHPADNRHGDGGDYRIVGRRSRDPDRSGPGGAA